MLRPQHFYNIYKTKHKWLVVIGSNLNLTLRLLFCPTITTCHLGFVIKMLWKYCGHIISLRVNKYIDIFMKNVVSTTFSQQIIGDRLLVVIGEQKSNLNCEFKLEPITTYCLWFVVKMLWT